jgi:curved DNA-binding protein CbpA
MDPYEVLGLSNDASNSEIKAAYKHLIFNTHPDKPNGNKTLFDIVQKAYKVIKRERKSEASYPTTRREYEDLERRGKQPVSNENFNDYFDKHAMRIKTAGYGHLMRDGGTRESDSQLYKKAHNTFKNQVVKYRVPKEIEAQSIMYCEKLGSEQHDKSISGGYDYMKAHAEPDELRNNRRAYRNIDEIIMDRENTSMTRDELRKYNKYQEKMKKLERIRQQNVRSQDEKIRKHHEYINNFLSYK